MAGIDAQTVLCVHCDGANGSSLFTDSSQYAHPMTRVGIKVDTGQSKFGGASAKFTGTIANWITTPDSDDFNFSIGDFTIDFWVRLNSTADQTLIASWDVIADAGAFYMLLNGGNLLFQYRDTSSGSYGLSRAWNPTTGTWYHIAVIRSGPDVKLFVNGVKAGSTYNIGTAQIINSPVGVTLGSMTNATDGGAPLNGWMDEVRISKGIARWTTDFTPPTAAYSTGGGTYTDAPSGGIALDGSCVTSGTGGVTSDGGGIDANCVLMLHCDGADASTVFTDVSPSAHAMSRVQIKVDTAQSKFGGASALFQGNVGDWITTPDSLDWYFAAGDFTIDFWWRPNATTDQVLLSHWDVSAGNGGWYLMYTLGATFQFTYRDSLGNVASASRTAVPGGVVVGTWYHVAVVRSGGVLRFFVNGVQNASDYAIGAVSLFNSPNALNIGSHVATGNTPTNGWLDEIRISKGVARWTSNFTPPVAPYAPLTILTTTPSGGIVMGGPCATTRALSVSLTPSGGVVLGGSCVSSRVVAQASTPTGGIVLGGPVLTGPVKLTVRLLSDGIEVASWQHQLAGNQARVSWTQLQLPSLGVPVVKVVMGKAKLRLKAKPVVTMFVYTAGFFRATLFLRAKPVRAIEPDHIRPEKPKLRLKGKPFTLRMTQQLPVGKAKLLLRTKPIARAGVAGLVPSPPHVLILTPLVCQDKGVLTPTAPKSTLLIPTARRSL